MVRLLYRWLGRFAPWLTVAKLLLTCTGLAPGLMQLFLQTPALAFTLNSSHFETVHYTSGECPDPIYTALKSSMGHHALLVSVTFPFDTSGPEGAFIWLLFDIHVDYFFQMLHIPLRHQCSERCKKYNLDTLLYLTRGYIVRA